MKANEEDMKLTYTKRGSLLVLMAALAFALGSCSHKVGPSVSGTPPKSDSVVHAAVTPSKPVSIDTAVLMTVNRSSAVETYWRSLIVEKASRLYHNTGNNTIWFGNNRPSPFYETATALLMDAALHGLDPFVYIDSDFQERVKAVYENGADTLALARLDVAFTDRFLLFTTHVSEGRVTSVANGKSIWKRTTPVSSFRDVGMLSETKTADELRSMIGQLQPQHEQYSRLQQALATYRSLANDLGQPISVPSALKPGDRSVAIPLIRKRVLHLNSSVQRDTSGNLSVSAIHNAKDQDVSVANAVTVDQTHHDLSGTTAAADSLYYDQDLAAAVQLFQRRHGLTADGVVGERTLRFMNQKISDRVAQIALNMERLRWTSPIHTDRYLVVNIPDYKLTVYENAQRAFDMRVVVGSTSTPTPVFNDQLNHIVFSPTWTVPTSIIRNEIIPNLRKDSTYYSEKNFVIYKQDVQIDPALENWKDPNINPYQLRVVQSPGADNSLGAVKFMMPNNMSIYLHDTPSRRLFAKDYRALSHGCVRLHEPAKLAEYLLKDQQGWDAERIAKAMGGSDPATILLKKRYPVYLMYQTAWVDDEGLLQFREDIYGHDKAQLRQLFPPKPATISTVSVSAAGL